MTSPLLLVIGGSGFIGSHLVRRARDLNWQTTSLSLHTPADDRRVDGVEYLLADITHRDRVKNILGSRSYDYVVNLGGYVDHALMRDGGNKLIDSHFSSIQSLIEVLDRRKLSRFVQIGSSDEYGCCSAPQHEELREQPISPYALGKVASTQFLQMLFRTEDFPCVMLRFFLTYGPKQGNDRFIPQIIHGCLKGQPFPVSSGEQLRDLCFIDDVISAIMSALTASPALGKVINVASGRPTSIRAVIDCVREIIGTGNPKFGELSYRPSENMELYADISRAKKLLNWTPTTSLSTGLNKTIDWLRE